MTPPRVLPTSDEERPKIRGCYDRLARHKGNIGRVMVKAVVDAGGQVSSYEVAPGVEPWQKRTADCVMPLLHFEPGKRDGVPVSAVVRIPLDLQLKGSGRLEVPIPASTPAEIEEIYRACYPPDQLAVAEPRYRVTMNKAGAVRKFELVESSGIGSLDQAGECVLQKLKFLPARRGGQPVESTSIVPILLRPPS